MNNQERIFSIFALIILLIILILSMSLILANNSSKYIEICQASSEVGFLEDKFSCYDSLSGKTVVSIWANDINQAELTLYGLNEKVINLEDGLNVQGFSELGRAEIISFPGINGVGRYVVEGIYTRAEIGNSCIADEIIFNPCEGSVVNLLNDFEQLSIPERDRRTSNGGGGGRGFDVKIEYPNEGDVIEMNMYIPLIYDVYGDYDICWYILDEGDRVYMPDCKDTNFNAREGNHTLEVFANDSRGRVESDKVSFRVDGVIGGECDEDQLIFRLFSERNTHTALWNTDFYQIYVCYNDIFGENFDAKGKDSHSCTGENGVLRLIQETNSHANAWEYQDYPLEICYGDLKCEVKEQCIGDERVVVGLSDYTNAHLELNYVDNYNLKVCCSSSGSF